ncbi:MAG: DUF2917 domain-containing protein [Rhodocyclaceae bacterium]
MSTTTESTRYTLGQRELMALEHPHGFALECVTGELWITAEGTAGDIILLAGQRLRLESTPKIVVSALRPSVVAAAPCCGTTPIRRIAARCAALLADRIERWRYPALASYAVTRLI